MKRSVELESPPTKRSKVDDEECTYFIPDDVLESIFHFLDFKELSIASLVCKQWNNISKRNQIWKGMIKKYKSGEIIYESYDISFKDVCRSILDPNYTLSCCGECGENAEFNKSFKMNLCSFCISLPSYEMCSSSFVRKLGIDPNSLPKYGIGASVKPVIRHIWGHPYSALAPSYPKSKIIDLAKQLRIERIVEELEKRGLSKDFVNHEIFHDWIDNKTSKQLRGLATLLEKQLKKKIL